MIGIKIPSRKEELCHHNLNATNQVLSLSMDLRVAKFVCSLPTAFATFGCALALGFGTMSQGRGATPHAQACGCVMGIAFGVCACVLLCVCLFAAKLSRGCSQREMCVAAVANVQENGTLQLLIGFQVGITPEIFAIKN